MTVETSRGKSLEFIVYIVICESTYVIKIISNQ